MHKLQSGGQTRHFRAYFCADRARPGDVNESERRPRRPEFLTVHCGGYGAMPSGLVFRGNTGTDGISPRNRGAEMSRQSPHCGLCTDCETLPAGTVPRDLAISRSDFSHLPDGSFPRKCGAEMSLQSASVPAWQRVLSSERCGGLNRSAALPTSIERRLEARKLEAFGIEAALAQLADTIVHCVAERFDAPRGQSVGRINLERDELAGERMHLFERQPFGRTAEELFGI